VGQAGLSLRCFLQVQYLDGDPIEIIEQPTVERTQG